MKKVSILLLMMFIALSNLIAIETVRLNGGVFTQGSPIEEAGRSSNESQRQVTLSPFFIGKYEVTQSQYEEIMGTNPSHNKAPNLPVEQVSWFEAIEFCNKLSEKEGLTPVYTIDGRAVTWNRNTDGYRLPTEAEWEYACRAGTLTVFSTGINITSAQANYDGTRPFNNNERTEYRRTTIPAGSFAPNAFGLFDMHGNVGEWCWDINGVYAAGPQTDPAGAASGGYRIFRGGGWNHPADFLRSAKRSANTPTTRGHYLGFRVARNAN